MGPFVSTPIRTVSFEASRQATQISDGAAIPLVAVSRVEVETGVVEARKALWDLGFTIGFQTQTRRATIRSQHAVAGVHRP